MARANLGSLGVVKVNNHVKFSVWVAMSTRKLMILAFLCGMAILVAFAVQVIVAR